MDEYIAKCPQPLRTLLAEFDTRVRATCTDATMSHSPTTDLEGWLDYALPGEAASAVVFAGVRFRRDKASATVALAKRPDHDPMEWVHENLGKVRRLPFAFGLPRPFKKDVGEDEWLYVADLVRQACEKARAG